MEKETDLQNINQAENKNFGESIQKFSEEVDFYYRVEKMFLIGGRVVPDEYSVISNLFQLCHHNLIFSFINLLRVHLSEPGIVNRKSIEAIGQATIIAENPDIYSRIWCKGENEKETKENKKLFKGIFKNDKFKNCKNKEELKNCYRIFSVFAHVNITTGMHRFKRADNKMMFGYFDLEVDDIGAWMTRYLNYTLLTYILILEEFADTFGDVFVASKEHLDGIKNEHKLYMETKRELLSQNGKYI